MNKWINRLINEKLDELKSKSGTLKSITEVEPSRRRYNSQL